MSSEPYLDELIFNARQQRILGILPLFTAPLSAVGSTLIIYVVIVEREKTLKSVYHRLILAISIVDLVVSLGMIFLGPWAVPESAKRYVAGARGTVASCEASGFLLNYLFGSMWYSAFLAVYFLCKVRFEWQEATMAKCLEPLAHLFAIIFPTVSGIDGIISNQFNPLDSLPGFCWFTPYPPNCEKDSGRICERGSESTEAMSGTAIFLFCVIAVSMALILCKVRSTETRLQQYGAGRDLVLTKETAIQALLYIGVFIITFFPVVLLEILYFQRYSRYYVIIAAMVKILSPLHGLFNAVIYMRKRYRELFRDGGSLSFFRRRGADASCTSTSRTSRKPDNTGVGASTSMTTGENGNVCGEGREPDAQMSFWNT